MGNESVKAILEGLHRNPLTAYSTQQLEEELARRCREHAALRLKVKLRLIRWGMGRRRTSENTF